MKSIFATLLAASLLAAGTSFAGEVNHDHHSAAPTAGLHLNHGQKWETDAALRKAMSGLRQSTAKNLTAIHENRVSAQQYAALAQTVNGAVSSIVAQCKLPPAADEQLHLIVAELLAGAEQMAGKNPSGSAQQGAIKVINALDNYGQYFNDPGFKPLTR